MMFVRPARPTSRAIRPASIAYTLDVLGDDLLLHRPGERIPDLIGRPRAVEQQASRRRPPRPSTSACSSSPNWWQPTKPACCTRYGARIGFGPKRRCETVCEPDFFES